MFNSLLIWCVPAKSHSMPQPTALCSMLGSRILHVASCWTGGIVQHIATWQKYIWDMSLPCWLIWDRFQVVMSWAELAQLKRGRIWGGGGSGSDPSPLKMSVIAYFWQNWPCCLIWNRFQVVTLWAELARFYGTLIKGLSGAPHQKKKSLLIVIFSTPYHAGYIAICFYFLLFELS